MIEALLKKSISDYSDQEYDDFENLLKEELLAIRKARKKYKEARVMIPANIATKYGYCHWDNRQSACYLPFLDHQHGEMLSKAIRGSLFPSDSVYKTVRLLDLAPEEYSRYTECLDKILAILYDYYLDEEENE